MKKLDETGLDSEVDNLTNSIESSHTMTTIPNIQAILFLMVLITLTACTSNREKNKPVWSDLPTVMTLDSLKRTNFVTTLENKISEDKNIIYAPAFLYTWDRIKQKLKYSIIVDSSNSVDFRLLNQSTTYQGSLADTEYSSAVEIVDGVVIAKAFFNKTLPFETKLQSLDEPIRFDNKNVSAFGMYNYNVEAAKVAQILYYRDDNNFILRLKPKDNQHEILLEKGIDKYQTLEDAMKQTNDLIAKGKVEHKDAKLLWKYEIVNEDVFSIPVIKFNIATHYKTLEKQSFFTNDNQKYSFEEAYQRTGFILNENGAVVESEAVALLDSTRLAPITHPKKMIFDKPFLIIIKRTDKVNPYFVMKIANTELLTIK